jgi:hypothetical protein
MEGKSGQGILTPKAPHFYSSEGSINKSQRFDVPVIRRLAAAVPKSVELENQQT